MTKVNTISMAEEEGLIGSKYGAIGKDVSISLGREGDSTDLMKRHPFDVEISRIPAGRTNTLFHAHSAQWEFYHVIEGHGKVRDERGLHPIEKGDAFLFKPGEAHQTLMIVAPTLSFTLLRTIQSANRSIYRTNTGGSLSLPLPKKSAPIPTPSIPGNSDLKLSRRGSSHGGHGGF
jgi:mannose-6-phosphate isomerase-like protein (cupin superfamily)